MRNLPFLVLLFLLSSCVTPLMEEASQIKLLSLEEKLESNCSSIGLVYGGSSMGNNTGGDMENSMNEVMNKAYQKGANAVYLKAMNSTTGGTGVVAEALSCEDELTK